MIYAIKSLITITMLIIALLVAFFLIGFDKKKANLLGNILIFMVIINLMVIIWLY
jgi:uncharacterized membrane protein YkgB